MALLLTGPKDNAIHHVIDRVSRVEGLMVQSTQLFPLSLQFSNDASPKHTQLTIRSTDTVGFLFAFTNAMTALNLDIDHAEARTIREEVQDIFWLTDLRGGKITSPDHLEALRVATTLIKHFTHVLPHAANPAQALRRFHSLTSQMLSRPNWTAELRGLESIQVLETLAQMMGTSQGLWDDFLRMQHENLFPVVVDVPALEQPHPAEQLRNDLNKQLEGVSDFEAQVHQLNRFKDREMFRIDLRHITGRIGFNEFSAELSDLAAVVVVVAATITHTGVAQQDGSPLLADGLPCQWAICALGKFGGQEMGFGSDIELLFFYEAEGRTSGPKVIENSLYFDEFVRVILSVIKVQRDGIFEIDLRLRPYGSAGPLASSLSAFERYYSESGDAMQFERMALVKLRFVVGDPDLAARIVHTRDSFVYSETPLDVENILHLRQRQMTEMVAPGVANAKYSSGGLVDMEYFTQALQIVMGHKDESVRVSNTLDAIERLSHEGYLDLTLAEEIRSSYSFLRRLIDALRVVRGNAKDLAIPSSESQEFAYLARRLQYETTAELNEAIKKHMFAASQFWINSLPF